MNETRDCSPRPALEKASSTVNCGVVTAAAALPIMSAFSLNVRTSYVSQKVKVKIPMSTQNRNDVTNDVPDV